MKLTLIHKMPVFYEVFWSQNQKIHLIWQETTTSTSRVPIAAWTQFRWFFMTWRLIFQEKSTARRVLLKAVSMFSLERGPLVPTQILWKSFSRRIMLLLLLLLLDPKPGRENRPERMHEWVPNQWPARYEEFNWLENFKNICCNICYPIKSAF